MTNYELIEKAIKYIESNVKQQPTLEEISQSVGMSPFHFQRIFTEWAGISPKKFLETLTLKFLKENLQNSSQLETIYNSGLSSTSRLHELFVNVDAVTPKEFKLKGQNLKISYSIFDSQFGKVLIAVSDKGITNIEFIDLLEDDLSEKAFATLKLFWPNAVIVEDRNVVQKYYDQIFNGEPSNSKLNLYLKGTNFQIQVWKALLRIPKGQLSTYSKIANEINSKAVRAVGTAIGHNPISYLIPCHRVINSTGVAGNYRWGSSRKKAILIYENSRE